MDRICIRMPDTLRDFLVATAVLQDYLVRLAIGSQRNQRDREYDVTIRMDSKFKYLTPCLQVIKEYVPTFDFTGWFEQARTDFDNFIDFDKDHVLALTHAFPDAHLTEGFGILIGVGPLGVITGADIPRWPSLDALGLGPKLVPQLTADKEIILLPEQKLRKSVGIIPWDVDETAKFVGFLETNYPDLDIHQVDPDLEDVELLIRCISNLDLVVGAAGDATYVALSLEKALLEIYPNAKEALMYNGVGLACYNCMVGNPTATFLWPVWEALWESYVEHSFTTNKEEPTTPMELLASTADSVVEKS